MKLAFVGTALALSSFVAFGSLTGPFGLAGTSPRDAVLQPHNAAITTFKVGATPVQDVQPRVEQRGVGFDGTLRSGATVGFSIAGNPFGSPVGGGTHNGLRLDTGTWAAQDVDIAMPTTGPTWVIGRSFNARQDNSGTARDSAGPMGNNWFQASQPELLFYDDATTAADDLIYLIYGADRFVEYKRIDASNAKFRGILGATGILDFREGSASTPDTYALIDGRGWEFVFFGFDGFDTGDEVCAGQLWKIIDPDGNIAYVGSTTDGDTAISDGFDSSGRITKAYDDSGNGRRFTYTYTSDLLTQVKVETKTGGSWHGTPTGVTEVNRVDYHHYGASETHGVEDDLKLVTITTPLSDSGVDSVRTKYFRYWKDADSEGDDHQIKLVVGFEGARRYDWLDSDLSDTETDLDTPTDATLKEYASAYFEYDTSDRVNEAYFGGECGCGGAGDGTHYYTYGTSSYTDDAGYDNEWATRTVIQRPDGSYRTQYFDEVGQPLSSVVTESDPTGDPAPDFAATHVERNSDGAVTEVRTPANATGYTHSTGTVTGSTSAGLIWVYTRISSGTTQGFEEYRKFKKGTSGSEYFDAKTEYSTASRTVNGDDIDRVFISKKTRYETEATTETDARSTEYSTSVYTSDIVTEVVTTTPHDVTTSKNGDLDTGDDATNPKTKEYFEEDGTNTYSRSGSGIITYREFTNGQVTKVIQDADTDSLSEPSGFTTTSSSPLDVSTTYAYDEQGRLDTTTLPDGRVLKRYYSQLDDGRPVTLEYSDYASGSGTFYGPVSYTVTNLAGMVEAQATVAISGGSTTNGIANHVDEADDDPITAMDLGSLASLTTSVYDKSGSKLEETRLYHTIPASGDGSTGRTTTRQCSATTTWAGRSGSRRPPGRSGERTSTSVVGSRRAGSGPTTKTRRAPMTWSRSRS